MDRTDPRIFLLPNEQGKKVFVPDFSFERWERLIQIERSLRPAMPPRHSFTEHVLLDGEVHDTHILLRAHCHVRLNGSGGSDDETSPSWTRVPLRFDRAIRTPDVEHIGPGDARWMFELTGEGHVVWIRASAGSEHQLIWTMKVPLVRRGNEAQLALRVPATSVRLRMTLPGSDLEVSLARPDENILSTNEPSADGTRIVVEGVGNNLQLSWRDRDVIRPVIDASGTSTIRLIGREIESTATLRVRSFGSPVDGVRVRLPPNAVLVPMSTPGLEIRQVGDSEPRPSESQAVRVSRRDGTSASEFDFTLQVRQPLSGNNGREEIETAGFEVVGALRQSGQVDLQVEGEWNVEWEAGPYVRQIRGSEEQSTAASSIARFSYSRQPYTLKVTVSPRQSHISVEPTYIFDVGQSQAQLDALMSYRITGPRAKTLQLELPDWTVDEVLPMELIESFEQRDSQLSIYITPNPTSAASNLELRIIASQAYDRVQPLRLRLPRPAVEFAAPATVAIVSADNVQLAVRPGEVVGLIEEPLPEGIGLPERQQGPLGYREDFISGAAEFVADVALLPQRVSVSVFSDLVLAADHVEVAQMHSYSIEHEPLSRLTLEIPRSLSESGEWEVTMGGVQLPVFLFEGESAIDSSDQSDSSRRPVLDVDLREERIGDYQIQFRYQLALEGDFSESQSGVARVELVQPAEDEFTTIKENTLRVSSSDFFDTRQVDQEWQIENDRMGDTAALAEPVYRAAGRVERVMTEIIARPQQQNTKTLKKVWLQTWLTNSERRDRASYQLLTNDTHVEVRLPRGVSTVDVAVNGQERQPEQVTDGLIRVNLGNSASVRPYTLEVWYWASARATHVGRISASVPRIVGVERADRLFWQVIVPRTEHLLWSPKNLTPEFVWTWSGSHWGRTPDRGQLELETSLQASFQDPIPKNTNQYLFSSVGPFQVVEFYTASRVFLVVVLSAFALAVGLPMIYIQRLRHPAVILVIGVVILAVSVAFTGAAILAAQGAVLGLILVLVAQLLQWTILIRPRSWYGGVLPISGRSVAEPAPSEPPREPGSSQLPTTVAPVPYQVTQSES